jgi:hypothetical protein
LKLRINFFGEQDNKNKTLQQTLTDQQKLIMYQVGDTLNKSVSSGAELVTFNTNDIFYWKKETQSHGQCAGLQPTADNYTPIKSPSFHCHHLYSFWSFRVAPIPNMFVWNIWMQFRIAMIRKIHVSNRSP